MTKTFAGVPESLAALDLQEAAVHLTLDEAVYPLEAIYGACFTFIDRCFVFLDRPEEGKVRAVLSAKKGTPSEEELREMVGEFANEALACAWRHRITLENRASIEAVTSQAIGAALGAPSLDELEDFDFSEEPFEDPLGIAQSWEEKYAKDPAARREGEIDEAADASEGEPA